MAKGKKASPQDLYLQRKQREEEEKNAAFPPGLVNHGNTCFMNSTLQGLIATPLLHSLVNFEDVALASSSSGGISARRSPQLTNGHGRGGEYERQWEKGMPLGDVFVALLQKAWGLQQSHTRQSISPKEVLAVIGQKYDQYLDFRQQDAHEFLTHMLDAIRLEEIDVIKKRQPPPPTPPKGTKRRRTRASSDSQSIPSIPDEDKLTPFVDMVFRGQLASILVCDTCKKISVTTEDFHDLSLSIKPEDYVNKEQRKRDRFKGIAKKLRLIPKARMDRSSSVPTSPARSSLTLLPDNHLEVSGEGIDTRRRSLEHVAVNEENEEAKDRPTTTVEVVADGNSKASNEDSSDVAPKDESGHVSFAEVMLTDGERRDDAWGKLGRRISMSMGGAARREKRLSRSKSNSRANSRERVSTGSYTPRLSATSPLADGGYIPGGSPSSSSSPLPNNNALPAPHSPPPSNASGSPFSPQRQHSSIGLGDLIKQHKGNHHKEHHRPYQPSREESAFMRKVLADVSPSGSSTFSLIHQALSGHSQSPVPLTAQALLVKMGHLPGIEECLRLFTTVEVLEGDNMVGCHRCWKIANGTYKPRKDKKAKHEDDSEEDEDQDGNIDEPIFIGPDDDTQSSFTRVDPASSVDISSNPSLPGYISPASTTVINETATDTSSIFSVDNVSVSSAPTTVQSVTPIASRSPPTPLDADALQQPASPLKPAPHAPLPEYGGLPIPSISTTEPETPISTPGLEQAQESSLTSLASKDTLQPPVIKKYRSGKDNEDGVSGEESYDSDSDASGDTSALSDVSSLASPSASPLASPNVSVERLPRTSTQDIEPSTSRPELTDKVPRSEQVILRRTYKRYLIATPPPTLVIHLKRFQQTSRSPYAMSFSSGFKKLDDFVAFPEYLDLAPYLAPRREDFGLGRKKKRKEKEKREKEQDGECMYKLYAVVVHIGNMLGGHYVAYTALPSPSSSSRPSTDDSSSSAKKSSTPNYSESKRQWAFISDTNVRLVSLEEVLKAKAYLCMYERI
ncbi:hypothetical protein BDY19DRAFT_994108 [Irpex rosettiformis]|uniref:Uncharacterized protein n=1 Tax=Irpex rosettiformis TaxID=378272 RepID=A0ACB8U1T5_9APHY|nr:hypothetical protein BDY19DRAFT_994108 [Irpex rosettiformis]